MAGTLKVGGVILATHSDSTGLVSLDSSITGSPNIDVITNTGSGFKPAEVWLSTTILSTTSPENIIDLPSGYDSYKIDGLNISFSESSSVQSWQRLYFQYDNNGTQTDDSVMSAKFLYTRIGQDGSGGDHSTGYINLCGNMGGETKDNLDFSVKLSNATVPNRTNGYSVIGTSIYGHDDVDHEYHYQTFGRSESTVVINKLRFILVQAYGTTNHMVAPYTGKVVIYGCNS